MVASLHGVEGTQGTRPRNIAHMYDHAHPNPPRVRVTLPGGGSVEGRLLRWQRGAGGGWRADVVLSIPVTAVTRVPGQDYDQVPRVEASPGAWSGFVFEGDLEARGDATVMLHTTGCRQARGRLTLALVDTARFFLHHKWAVACEECQPRPLPAGTMPGRHRGQRVQHHRHRGPRRGPRVAHTRPRVARLVLRSQAAQAP